MTGIAEVEVLIVGGGPVGLSTRALLARWGVRTLLVEKYAELSPFPRSRLVNVRSMEIFRQLGIAETIAAGAFGPEYGRVRFRDTLFGVDFASAAMIGINAPIAESPVIGVVSSQDRLEPTLVAAADSELRFGVELVDLAEESDGVVAVLVDQGEEVRVRAQYVLAADGANSTVRERLGIGTTGPGALGRLTTVVFDAELNDWSAREPAGVYFTPRGSFLPIYPEGGWAWIGPTPEGKADWASLVSDALGNDLQVDVLRVQHWTITASIAEHFQQGRVLLAGDAAHTMPAAGGLGMNAGLADVHNLCWKLAGLLRGWAAPGLLETYESERLPVAHLTLRQAVANTKLMLDVQNRRGDLPWSEQYFAQLGLVLGVNYEPNASPPGTEYVPTVKPGHRMPHLWLSRDRSTLDTFGEWFTLLTADAAHWEQQTITEAPLHVETLTDEQAKLCDLDPGEALLIRPDGYIDRRLTPHRLHN